ncbi:MAG: hypothetical protein ACI4U5_06545 [Bacilli bacterium]
MNDATLKRIVCCMLSVWMSLITLLLLFIPLFVVEGKMVSGYVNTSILMSSSSTLLSVVGIMNYVLLGVLGVNLLFSIFFTLVTVGKIKVGPALMLFRSDLVSSLLSILSFCLVILQICLGISISVQNLAKFSAGLFVVVVVMLLFIIILMYVLFKFDDLAPLVTSKEKEIVKKQVSKNAMNKKQGQPQPYMNREQRRKANKNNKK